MRRFLAVLALSVGFAVPMAVVAVAFGGSSAFAVSTPTPTPSVGTGSSIGVTIGDSTGTGGGTGAGGSGHGGSGHGGSGGGSPTAPGTPSKPDVPATPTVTQNALKLNHGTFRPGQTLVAVGTGFTPGEKVQFVLYPGAKPVRTFTANASGTVHAVLNLSKRTATGSHVIEATGWQSRRVAAANYAVVTDGPAGAGTVPWLIWLIGGIAVSGAVLLACSVALGWLPRRPPSIVQGG